ncbi:transporter [Lithospermum erythrorhizon]|uniref:Transporter n=1 Tax=Lithospermum erythrorhizon TaxID=34254 RepID=A0AAV3RPK4_LITER
MDSANQKNGGFAKLLDWINKLGKFKDEVVNIAKETKKIGKDDPRRIIHAAKVGLALTLVSLFYYFKPLYDGFGQAGMWAVLTVVVVFEFSVGGTLCKCINRGCATLLAGALGIGAEYLAELTGKTGEPIMLGFFVFILATGSTFARFFPYLKRRYDYGILIFILTFSLVTVSGYRVEEIIELAHQRLSTIIIGAATCMIVSLFICPVWAGQDLHILVASNMEKVASFLEGFGDEYFHLPQGEVDDANTSKEGKLFLQAYKSVLGSKASEETLANAAWWEPGHGSFRFRDPCNQYLKVGALTRQCAYHIETLVSGYTNSNKQAQTEFHKIIQEPYSKMSSEAGKLLLELSSAIKNMTHPSSIVENHLHNMKSAIDDLKSVLQTSNHSNNNNKSNLLDIIPILAVGSILIDIIHSVEKVSEAVHELSNLGHFKKMEKQKSTTTFAPEKIQQKLHKGIVQPVNDNADMDVDHVVIEIRDTSKEIIHQENNGDTNKKQGQQQVEV